MVKNISKKGYISKKGNSYCHARKNLDVTLAAEKTVPSIPMKMAKSQPLTRNLREEVNVHDKVDESRVSESVSGPNVGLQDEPKNQRQPKEEIAKLQYDFHVVSSVLHHGSWKEIKLIEKKLQCGDKNTSSSLTLHSLSTFCPNFALQNTITSFRFSGGDN
ncbi:hypothetical protein LWI28_008231 [Acer negundo]|uniref:Uncharacterized protein n=1 Tax=Acer negundo TaxID=4023 RepID=A0AAD5I5D1_ACENE|nr:hypothetical protein LWI28_008231 [Acer negundo]